MKMVAAVVIGVMLLARGTAAGSAIPDDSRRCLTCHGMANLAVREAPSAPIHSFSVSAQTFAGSVHGKLSCQDCHGDVGPYPHQFQSGRVKVACAQQCHAPNRGGRPYSHAATVADFEASVHRSTTSGDPNDRPTCLSCHGVGDAHAIQPARHQPARARMAMCVSCHDDRVRMVRNRVEADAVSSYKRSFHYKAIRFGAEHAAVCQDCHTVHRILGPSDPKSSVAPAALPATCGQSSCHLGARTSFAVSGANHLDLRVRREPILWAEEWLFWILTSGTMAMLVSGIVLDIQKKFGWLELARRAVLSLRRQSDGLAAAGRRTIRFARWLLVE
jgi:hypothetical protein